MSRFSAYRCHDIRRAEYYYPWRDDRQPYVRAADWQQGSGGRKRNCEKRTRRVFGRTRWFEDQSGRAKSKWQFRNRKRRTESGDRYVRWSIVVGKKYTSASDADDESKNENNTVDQKNDSDANSGQDDRKSATGKNNANTQKQQNNQNDQNNANTQNLLNNQAGIDTQNAEQKEEKKKNENTSRKNQKNGSDDGQDGEADDEKGAENNQSLDDIIKEYYGEKDSTVDGNRPTASVTIKQIGEKLTEIKAGQTIDFKVEYTLTKAAYFSYGEQRQPLFDTYDDTQIILKLPEGISIIDDENLKDVTLVPPENPSEDNTWILKLPEKINASTDALAGFALTMQINGNGVYEDGHVFDFGSSQDMMKIQTSFTIKDRTNPSDVKVHIKRLLVPAVK